MAKYFDVHPDNPQPRALSQIVGLLRDDGLIAYPTDSCYALGCRIGNAAGMDRIRDIAAGEELTRENVRSIRPGYGLAPKHLPDVLGRRAARNLKRGEPLAWDVVRSEGKAE